jgi:hypothetical protein
LRARARHDRRPIRFVRPSGRCSVLLLTGDTHTAGALLGPGFQLIDVTGAPETRADYLAAIGGESIS